MAPLSRYTSLIAFLVISLFVLLLVYQLPLDDRDFIHQYDVEHRVDEMVTVNATAVGFESSHTSKSEGSNQGLKVADDNKKYGSRETRRDIEDVIRNPSLSTELEERCSPSSNIVYIKVHKTGSSTLQNIFFRFGDERHLTFALPKTGFYIEGIAKFNPKSVLPAPSGKTYNIMANHVRFHYQDIKKMMADDVKFVTLIRESASQFRSMYTYFVLSRKYKVDLKQYSLNPKTYYDKYGKNGRHSGLNPELVDLGFDVDKLSNATAEEEYIRFLEENINLVLITEHFLESLIMLKDLMCWDLHTLVHLKSKIRVQVKGSKSETTPAEDHGLKTRLNAWNTGDVKLYDHFNRTLWAKIEEYGKDRVQAEVEELKTLCRRYEDECMKGTKVRDISFWSGPIGLTEYVLREESKQNRTCQRLGMSEPEFVSYLRAKGKKAIGLT